jgi:DNA-binding CsgD family transcriptional regulator
MRKQFASRRRAASASSSQRRWRASRGSRRARAAEQACRAHAEEARRHCDELGLGLYGVWVAQALGDLALGLGRPEEAVAAYGVQRSQMDALGFADVDISPAPELVEAYLRLGRHNEAEDEAAAYAHEAEVKGQPWALARAARSRGLLAEDDELEACFDEALAQHARTLDGFETARTQLAYGARLRRARRRVRAREHLRPAYQTFEHLGAAAWAETAAAELAATGETARRRDVTTLDALTPQELQIALLLAQGKTTREAAAAVFLSPKTVEYHLRHVYRKLGINSREELAAVLVLEVGEVPDLLRRRRAHALPAAEPPAAPVVLAAGLSVPELPRDRRDEDEERRDARRVDLVTREHADPYDREQKGDKRAGRLAKPQHFTPRRRFRPRG